MFITLMYSKNLRELSLMPQKISTITKMHGMTNQAGHTTYTLTAPQEWVKEQGLQKGDYVRAIVQDDKVIYQKIKSD